MHTKIKTQPRCNSKLLAEMKAFTIGELVEEKTTVEPVEWRDEYPQQSWLDL